ncbi:MAG: lytic transglycosylase domain-containing protein [Pseudomonadota bacterium]|jgi:hypothetical protein
MNSIRALPINFSLSAFLSLTVWLTDLSSQQRVMQQLESQLARELSMTDVPHRCGQADQKQHATTLKEDTTVNFVAEMIRLDRPSLVDSDKLAQIIVTESHQAEIDPLFVAAVIRTESMFRHTAVSHRGAQGLMQLMPKTGHYVAKLSNLELKDPRDLHDPQTNIRLGISYLKYLSRRFNGDREKLLVAYNWGPGNLVRALTNSSQFPTESRQYVRKVLSRHSAWSQQFTLYAATKQTSALG